MYLLSGRTTGAVSPRRLSPRQLLLILLGASTILVGLGLSAGSDGLSANWSEDQALISAIRAPRTLGACLAGGLLGLAGALAQGLFRNPLADPYLLGSASGAGLGVVLVIAAGSLGGVGIVPLANGWLVELGLVGAAFVGALAGVMLTLVLAGGAGRPMVLLLAGVVVGVLLSAVTDALMLLSPQALRGRQAFMLGTTGYLGWTSVILLASTVGLAGPLAMRLAGVLDALILGEDGATSLGLALPRLRLVLVGLLSLCTAVAVAQAGLIAFVGLVAPHIVRRSVTVTHGPLLGLSMLTGAMLLLLADVAARSLLAPQELPVGLLTAIAGGLYLLALLRRQLGGHHG